MTRFWFQSPSEIRLIMYRLLFEVMRLHIHSSKERKHGRLTLLSIPTAPFLSCQKAFEEAVPLCYETATFQPCARVIWHHVGVRTCAISALTASKMPIAQFELASSTQKEERVVYACESFIARNCWGRCCNKSLTS